jgi:hypothetical protein
MRLMGTVHLLSLEQQIKKRPFEEIDDGLGVPSPELGFVRTR